MMSKTRLAAVAATFLGSVAMAHAQTAEEHSAHHPDTSVPSIVSGKQANRPAAPAAGVAEMEMGKMMPMMGAMMGMMPADHVEDRIAHRKGELAITDAQLPQWNAFAAVLRANAKTMQDGMAHMAKAGMPTTAPARGDAMVQMMATRLEGMKAVVRADKALYAVLSVEQRKTADQTMMGAM
jgi:hypothetical protein